MRTGMILDGEYLTDARVPNEARYLAKRGHDIYILCLNFGKRPNFEDADGVHIVRFNMSHGCKNILFGILNTFPLYEHIWGGEIKAFIEKYRIEALHVHDLYMAKAAYDANCGYKLPLTLDLHENYPAAVMGYTWANSFPRRLLAKPRMWKKKEHRYLQYADNIVVLSDAFRQTLCDEYPDLVAKKFIVYPNVPDVKWFQSLPVDAHLSGVEAGFVLFYFGVIGVRRGMITCFDALKLLVADIPAIKLMLIGPVDKADQPVFNRYINDPVIKDHIIYIAWKDVSDLPSYISASDICLAPFINSAQHDSGIANKVFQYMLFERAVLLSNSKPHQLLVSETHCGVTFCDTDTIDMADKIRMLYHHPALRKEMGKNGRQAVLEKYNLETAGKELERIYGK